MFPMPSPTRLLVCRIGIVVFCLLPTATVGGWIAQRTSGQFAIAQRAEWERELTGRLGFKVEIGSVSYPSHSLATLEGVRLHDPETHALIAQAGLIEVAHAEDGWQVQAWQPRIAAGRLTYILRTIDERLLRTASAGESQIAISARELLVEDQHTGLSLVNVTAQFDSTPQGPAAELRFQPPSAAAPISLIIARNRQGSAPITVWQLDTGTSALPVELLAAAAPQAGRLGSNCRFAGQIALEDSAGKLSGQWSGTLTEVDLDSLVTEHFPHQLSGLATVKIERATLNRGKLTEIRGTVQARDGAISHSLLTAAQEHLQLELASENPSIQPGRAVAYRQLSLGFAISERGLSLTGSADPTQPGVLLANAAGPLLTAPPQHAAPPTSLLRALLPDNEYQVPATRQTDALVSLLPVPDLAPAQTARRGDNHTPTRLAPATSGGTRAIRQPVVR
jgi:hypothetical protein